MGALRGSGRRSSSLASAAAAGSWPGRRWSWPGSMQASQELSCTAYDPGGQGPCWPFRRQLKRSARALRNQAEIRFVASHMKPIFQMMSGLLRRAASSCRSTRPSLASRLGEVSPSLVARLGRLTVPGTQALARRCHQPSAGRAHTGRFYSPSVPRWVGFNEY